MKDNETAELVPIESSDSSSSILSSSRKVLRTGFKESVVPTIILDSRLNIVWENASYRDLFSPGDRSLPWNLVEDFSPYIDTVKLRHIYTSLTAREKGFSYRGRLESKKKDRLPVIANIIILPLFQQNKEKKQTPPQYYTAFFDDLSREHKNLLQKTFISLLEASKLKDNDTGNHIKRVGEYSKVIAGNLFGKSEYPAVDREFIDNILFLAPMHDVGKIGTPDDILNKAGPLDEKEWVIMKEHTKNGAYILQAYPNPMAKDIAIFHHEKWNGSGYPYGIDHETIPLAPRIVAIADVYDALRMKRSYKEPFSHRESVSIIKKDSGSHFDPALVTIFLSVETQFNTIFEKLKDS